MNKAYYETHYHSDPAFPLIFHYNFLTKGLFEVYPHWHISVELLYVMQGTVQVTINTKKVIATTEDIIVINSNSLHSIQSMSENCAYYCLIIDHEHAQTLGFDTTNNNFIHQTTDPEMKNIFNLIIKEMTNKKKYYKKATVALCTTMLILLFRNQWLKEGIETHKNASKVAAVKDSIIYINQNYQNLITIDDISKHVGISKYYFCRIFKEITNLTVNEYIINLRVKQARYFILEENYNVGEAAEATGFNNLSYFSQRYKKVFGVLPSKDKRSR